MSRQHANHRWVGSEWTPLRDLTAGTLVGFDYKVWRVVEVSTRPADLVEHGRTHAVIPRATCWRQATPLNRTLSDRENAFVRNLIWTSAVAAARARVVQLASDAYERITVLNRTWGDRK